MKSNFLKVVVSAMFLISSIIIPTQANAACDRPSQLLATTNGSTVSFTWSGNGTGYLIEVENTSTNQKVIPESNASSPHSATLTNGSYKFKIRTLCGNDKSNWSDWVSFSVGSTGPNTPGGGTGGTCTVPTQLAASTTTTGASLSWTGTAAAYQIEVENTATDINVVPEQSAASPFAVNLPAGSYKFKVRSVCGADHSDWSPTFAFTIGSTGPNPPGGGTGGTCTIPTQLAASTTTTGASLSWTGTAAAYQIEVENTATDVNVVPEQSAASPFAINLPAGSYKFKVRSVCGSDHSDWSPTFAFTIGSTGPNPPGGGTGGTCTVPTQLASSVSGQEVKLSWIGTASSFQIEIENVENGSTIVAEQTTTNPYFNSFIEGRYKFKVRSLCDGDKSDWSAWSSFLINSGTSAPGNDPTVKIDTTCTNQVSLSILNAKDTSLTLKWQSAGAGVKYNIEVESEETVTKFRFKQEDYKDTSIVINGLIPNTQYKISITINCGNGISTKTNVVQSVTPLVNPTTNTGGGLSKFACDIPTGLSVQIDAAGILISWLPSAGARSYQIELESQGNTPAFKRAIAVSSTFFLFNTTLAAGNYKVKVRPSCLSGKGAWSPAVSFTLSQAIAIKSAIENRSVNTGLEMEVYPNPATSSINLKTNNKYGIASSGLVQIINFQGQVVQEFRNFDLNSNQKIGIQNLVPGIYYIKLDTEYSQNIKKLIVN